MNALKSNLFFVFLLLGGTFLVLWGVFRHFTIDYLVFCYSLWSGVNLYGIVSIPFGRSKVAISIFLVSIFSLLFVLLQRFVIFLTLKISLVSLYTFVMGWLFYKKSPKKNLKNFLLPLQFLFFILIIITLVNIEAPFLGTDFISPLGRASGFMELGFVFFILYFFLYYSEELDLELGVPGYRDVYKKRMFILLLSIISFFAGLFFLLIEYKMLSFAFIIGLIGMLSFFTALFYVKKRYEKYG